MNNPKKMRNLRPPPQNYNNSNTYNNPQSSSSSRSPMANQTPSNNNLNNNRNINNPFPSSRPTPPYTNQNSNYPPTNTNTNNNQSKSSPFPKMNNNNNIPSENREDVRRANKDYDNDMGKTSKDEEEDNYIKKPKTSQKHKTPDSSYSINPNHIPRPNQNDEIYINNSSVPPAKLVSLTKEGENVIIKMEFKIN